MLTLVTSCRLAKNVSKGHFLMRSYEVKLQKSGGTVTQSDLEAIVRQQPNQTILGIPLRLMAYNAVDSAKTTR